MSWITRATFRRYSVVSLVAIVSLALGLCRNASAQADQFSSEADAISGTVTKTLVGLLPTTVTIAPVDQSNTVTTGSNDVPANSATQTIFGVEVFNFSNIDDSTSDSATAALDDGVATASTGAGSLLGGLVTWQSNIDPLTCTTDSTIAGRINCSSAEITKGLAINGVVVPAGTYPSGATFPVTGTINDPECSFGTETFSGTLLTQETQITGLGTANLAVKLIGLHLVGDATCRALGLVPSFVTHYDLSMGGPRSSSDGDEVSELAAYETFENN